MKTNHARAGRFPAPAGVASTPRLRQIVAFAVTRIVSLLVAAVCVALPASSVHAQTWSYSGSMSITRSSHTATLLANGKVLVTGGHSGTMGLASTEIYDPATGTWTVTGPMTSVRWSHTAVLLADGRVLVSGGYDGADWLRTAEVYNPATGSWSAVANLNSTRLGHTLTLLNNGKVLMAGGSGRPSTEWYLVSTEVFDPATGTWTPTGNVSRGRYLHTAHLLPGGKVIVIGGYSLAHGVLSHTETYDPATGSWSFSGSMHTPRYRHPSTVLSNGRILVAGGAPDTGGGGTTSAELYDPATQIWTITGSLSGARFANPLNALPNGKAITAGGYRFGPLATAELFDPASGTWASASPLNTGRIDATYTTLQDGAALLTGGGTDINGGSPVATTETFSIGNGPGTWTSGASLLSSSFGGVMVGANGEAYAAFPGPPGDTRLQVYNPGTNSWRFVAPGLAAVGSPEVEVVNGKLYAVGGASNSDARFTTNLVQVYDIANNSWSYGPAAPTARAVGVAGVINGKLYVTGGLNTFNGFPSLGSLEIFNPATNAWSTGASMPTRRSAAVAGVINGKLYVAGGDSRLSGSSSNAVGVLEVYDPATNTWQTRAPMPTPRFRSMGAVLNGKLHVVGGQSNAAGLTVHEVYDPVTDTWTTDTPLAPFVAGAGGCAVGSRMYVGGGTTSGGNVNALSIFTLGGGDVTPPVLTVPTSQTLEATSEAGAMANFAATATDNSGSVTITYSQNSGTMFPLGTTIVMVTARDAAGNLSSGSFAITVRDTIAPAITSVSPSVASLWPANHKMVAVTVAVHATDQVGVSSRSIIAVDSNEPDNGLGDGDTADDIQITGPLSVNLRAERSGAGSGRVYTITVRITDAAGNFSDATTTVSVPRNQR